MKEKYENACLMKPKKPLAFNLRLSFIFESVLFLFNTFLFFKNRKMYDERL